MFVWVHVSMCICICMVVFVWMYECMHMHLQYSFSCFFSMLICVFAIEPCNSHSSCTIPLIFEASNVVKLFSFN